MRAAPRWQSPSRPPWSPHAQASCPPLRPRLPAADAGPGRLVRVRHRRHLRRPRHRRHRPRQLRRPGLVASSWFQYAGEQAPYTPHSGDRRATLGFDGSSATSAIGFLTPSTFQGAWFAGFDGVNIAIDLYRGGLLVASTSTLNLGETPAFLASGYTGLVDRLVFRSNDPAFFVMDDLSFAAAVPEPASGALALAGLAVAALVIRRRQASHSAT
ncbi:PEP-CTERM sorting domain-containing protein [Mitsuaria sp. TWR114]|uniref:PEP-CTERM sorting domain-containing protein n=1 Tax=Mitsuaria sp. TWR114 TaxID=2601731 RepID=UPI001C9B5AB5|nr:PEP-CTERM sorting domain-containing protein [Mitsuaria sp. TWR114]